MSKKIFGLVALFAAVVLLGGVNTAKAATAQELQDQINALLAQIGSLQGGTSTSCYSFTRDLTVGSQGADVTALQNYLAAKGYFNVAATGYFGAVTAQAAAAWQSANGVMPAAGYFGAISRAKYNSMCSSTPTTGDDDDDDDTDLGNDGEEASLEDFDAQDGDDTSLEEGQEDAEVLEFEFDVEDSDVEVQRVQVNLDFQGETAGEEDPWKVFTDAKLWMDGEEVASADDLSDEDNWDDEGSGEYSFRFNGVDTVVGMGDTAKFVVSLSVEDSIDGSSSAANNEWDISVDTDSVRALDEAGIDQYTGDSADTVQFDIEEAGGDNELNMGESSDNPESTVLEVDDSDTSDWMTVGIAQLSAEGDIEVNELVFVSTVSSSTYTALVNDAQILIDGQEYSDFSVSGGATTVGTLTFDLSDEDIVIEDGEEVDVEVQLEFKALALGDEGTTVQLTATSGIVDLIDAEGATDGENLDGTQLTGSFEGEVHTLRTEGISVAMIDSSAEAPVGENEASAEYTIEFSVTAFGADWYLEKSAARDASPDNSDGVEFVLENSAGTEYSTTTITVTADLDGDLDGDTATHYKVPEGDTRTFTLSVGLDNSGASAEGQGFYRVHITGIGFDSDGSGAASSALLSTGLEDFHTDTEEVDDANI